MRLHKLRQRQSHPSVERYSAANWLNGRPAAVRGERGRPPRTRVRGGDAGECNLRLNPKIEFTDIVAIVPILRRSSAERLLRCSTAVNQVDYLFTLLPLTSHPRCTPRRCSCASGRWRQHAWLGADRHRKGRPSIDRSLPALELRIGRALDRKLQATLHDRAERNVGDGETIEREPMAPGDVAIEYLELGEEIGALRRKIARALGRRLLGVSEHGDIRRVQGAEQKVHPTLDRGALGRARSGQRRPMHGAEIAKDGMGFPDDEIAVDQGRDLRSGVELAVCLGQRVAELATIVLADIGQAEFLQAEDDLLHVSRRLSAEQSDHVTSSSVAERRSDFALQIEDRFAAWRFSRRAACRQWRPFRSWYR